MKNMVDVVFFPYFLYQENENMHVLFNNEKNKGLLYVQDVYTNCIKHVY